MPLVAPPKGLGFCAAAVEPRFPNNPPPLDWPPLAPPDAAGFPKEKVGVPVAWPNRLVEPGAAEVVVVAGPEEAALEAGVPKLNILKSMCTSCRVGETEASVRGVRCAALNGLLWVSDLGWGTGSKAAKPISKKGPRGLNFGRCSDDVRQMSPRFNGRMYVLLVAMVRRLLVRDNKIRSLVWPARRDECC